MKFNTYYLSDLYDISSGLSKKREEFGFGYPFLTFKEVFHNTFLPSELTELANTTENERIKCSIRKGDVFLTRTSEKLDELGLSSVALKDYPNATFNGFTKRLRPNNLCNKILLPKYAAFYFRSQNFRSQITSFASMTTRASLNNEIISKLTIDVPPVEYQKQVINILDNLLNKEKNNFQIIEKLEQISQTLFKHWFIDFEFPNEEGKPYKSSGGEMVESELGEIPKGWYYEKFNSIMKISSGKRPKIKTENYSFENPIPIIGASKIMGYTRETLFDSPILVIGRVGTHGVVQKIIDRCWPSDNTLVIQSEFYNFVYEFLKVIDYKSLNRGSTQPLITQTDIKNQLIILPENQIIMKKFEGILNPLLNKQFLIKKENGCLIQLRDTLLPKLLSGEIEIPDNLEV